MSVAEIKEEMRKLSVAELADIEQLASDLRRAAEAGVPAIRHAEAADPDVPAALDAVFAKHRELLHRLAQ
jgi:hypothetical protein